MEEVEALDETLKSLKHPIWTTKIEKESKKSLKLMLREHQAELEDHRFNLLNFFEPKRIDYLNVAEDPTNFGSIDNEAIFSLVMMLSD